VLNYKTSTKNFTHCYAHIGLIYSRYIIRNTRYNSCVFSNVVPHFFRLLIVVIIIECVGANLLI